MGKFIDVYAIKGENLRVGDWYADAYGIAYEWKLQEWGSLGWVQRNPKVFEKTYMFECSQWKEALHLKNLRAECCNMCHKAMHYVCVRRVSTRSFKVCCRLRAVCMRKLYG